MSGTWTVYGREQLVGLALSADTVHPPGNLYVALCLVVPVSNTDGTALVEPDPVATGYTRSSVTTGSDNWLPTGFGEWQMIDTIVTMAPLADGGPIVAYALVDTATIGEGNVWAVGVIPDKFQYAEGVPLRIDGLVLGLYD